jgi:hypothetical protein
MPSVAILRPFDAYTGDEPYIFVSYSHKDAGRVFPELQTLRSLGYRIWYDEGIEPGNEVSEIIAGAILRCGFFLVFISPNAVNSRYVRDEINFAIDKEKELLAIHLEETKLPAGIELRMSNYQAIMKYDLTAETYRKKVMMSLPQKLTDKASISLDQSDTKIPFHSNDTPRLPRPSFPPERTSGKKPARWVWIGGSILAGLIAIIALSSLYFNPLSNPGAVSPPAGTSPLPTAKATAPPLPSPTPNPQVISGPANRYLPMASDYYVNYDIVENDSGLNMLVSQTFLPIDKENIATISFEAKNLFVSSNTPQNGIYSFLKYAIFIPADENVASVYLSSYSQDEIVAKAFLVIAPTSLINEDASIIEFSSSQPICDESRAFKLTFADPAKQTTSSPQINPGTITPIPMMPKILFIYSTCRIKNMIIAVWGETYDNLDGYNLPLPDSVLNKQVSELLQKVIEKLPAR